MKTEKTKLWALVIITFLMMTGLLAVGQGAAPDVVILKDGGNLKGTVLAKSTADTIYLQLAGGHVLRLPMRRIAEITGTQNVTTQPKPRTKAEAKTEIKPVKSWTRMKRGYVNFQELGPLIGGSQEMIVPNVGFSILTAHGYQILEHLAVSAGVGVDAYPQYGDVFFPLFGRVSGDVLKTKISPYWFIDAGYSLARPRVNEWQELTGGLLISAGAGVKFYLTRKTALSLSLSYKYQESVLTENWNEVNAISTFREFQRVVFRFGVGF